MTRSDLLVDPKPPERRSDKIRKLRAVGPRILRLAIPELRMIAVGLIALALGSGLTLLVPYLLRLFLNGDLGLHLETDLLAVTLILIGVFFLLSALFYLRHYCFWVSGYRIVTRLRNALYESVLFQDIAFFDQARIGDLLSRLTADTQLVQKAVTVNISVGIRYGLQIVGAFALMLVISGKLTAVILFLIPPLMLMSMIWGKRLRLLSKQMQEQLGEATVIAEESLGGIRTVRLFGGERYELDRERGAMEKALAIGVRRTHTAAFFSSAMVFLMYSGIAIAIWYGGELVLGQQLTIGDLIAFLFYCALVAVYLGFLANVWDEFLQAAGAGERIFELLDQTPTIVSPSQPKPLPELPLEHGARSVTFDRVTFAYPSRPTVNVLSDIAFTIGAGETVALVGPSGSGKSTIATLIPRFYDPTAGQIRYDGVPVNALDLTVLRSEISVVAQDPQLFSVSLRENIAYGRTGASLAEIRAAAEAAHIHSFVESLPQGYDTPVGDRGIQLSGGQRQRVAIARAILKDPKFLILDEATSALDSENEQLVQKALQRLMEGRTTLIIAHRLSTVQHADRVLVVKDGRICQSGSHQQLVREEGMYRTLVEHQLL